MFLFIVSLLAFAVAFFAILGAIFSRAKVASVVTALVSLLIGVICLFISTWWSNGVGEAKVMVNAVDRQIVGTIEEPGSGFKPAWVDFVEFDLFSQELKYAGGNTAPSYTGGSVNGREITVSVGGVSGGSTQANTDMTFVYSLNPKYIKDIYQEFRGGQTQFTEQVIAKQVLSIARQVPAEYTAIEFRGAKRGEVEEKIQKALNAKLGEYGVDFTFATIQDVRFSEDVENALTAIEQANQATEKAEAEQRTKAVENQTKIDAATAEAEANRVREASLSPAVLEALRLEALIEVSKNGDLIVDGGSGGILIQK